MLLPKHISAELVLRSGKSPHLPSQGKRVPAAKRLLLKQIQWNTFRGLLQEFLIIAQGRLPNEIVTKLFWQSCHGYACAILLHLLAQESCRMKFLVRTLFDQLFFLGTDDFLTPPVCMVRVCQQLHFLPEDMLGSSCVSLGVFSRLALGVRLFFFSGCSTCTA